jgi:hypothetical protein
MKAQKGFRGTAVLMLNLGVRLGWIVKPRPRRFTPRERASVHIVQGAERAAGSMWTDVEERKPLTFVPVHNLRSKKTF